MIEILTYVSLVTGGLLILMLLLSLIGGLDLELDIGGGDVDVDAGGLGLIKGALTFISVSTWVMKIILVGGKHPGIAVAIGVICGLLAFLLLSSIVKLLLKSAENVNWDMEDALFQKGEVYLKIPASKGEGIVHVKIKGTNRELKAKSFDNKEIITGSPVKIVEVDENYVIVVQEEKE